MTRPSGFTLGLLGLLLLMGCGEVQRGPWFDQVRPFTCARDPARDDGDPSPRRALEPGVLRPRIAPTARACPELPWGRPGAVGTVTEGYLCDSMRLQDDPHAPYVLLQATRDRGTGCASGRMVQVLTDVAARVREAHGDLRLPVGNVARCGGGDLPWSISHNTGRDADLFFYMRGPDGEQHLPYKVSRVDGRTLSRRELLTTYELDVDANLDMVVALVDHPQAIVQWIFVSRAIRKTLLDRAKERKIARRTRSRLASLLRQPSGGLPHDDHFHLRLQCDAAERRLGCVDIEPIRRGGRVSGPPSRRSALVRQLLIQVAKGPDRRAALDTLWVLKAERIAADVMGAWERLDDEEKIVALAIAKRDRIPAAVFKRLAARLRGETSARVVRHVIDFLFHHIDDVSAWGEIRRWAKQRYSVEDPADPFEDFRTDCLILEYTAIFTRPAFLGALLDISPPLCPHRPELRERVVELATALPARHVREKARWIWRLDADEARQRGLHERGYAATKKPTREELWNALSADNEAVAFNACYLIVGGRHDRLNVCQWTPESRDRYLRRKYR